MDNANTPIPEILLCVPWRHQTVIVSKCTTINAALFYLDKVVEGNMSRTELENIVKAQLYEHTGKALNYVHPEWQDSQSDLRYERKYESTDEEDERLWDEEDSIAPTHLWNIIAELGHGCHHRRGFVACFERLGCERKTDDWDDINSLLGEDGRTWDEGIHYPAYQDQYFLMPFHHLYCDLFLYSLEDLCNINDFRVNVEVRLVTREQDKIGK